MMTQVTTYLKGLLSEVSFLMQLSRQDDVHCPTCSFAKPQACNREAVAGGRGLGFRERRQEAAPCACYTVGSEAHYRWTP